MKCNIVKDLLPNYIEGLTSEETNNEISKHLESCAFCKLVYENMTASIVTEIIPQKKEIGFLRKLKVKMIKVNAMVAVITLAIVLICLIIFARSYEIPIPFDPNRISVDLIPMAVVYNDDGTASWWDHERFNSADEYEYVRESLHISWVGFSNISMNSIGRDIIRDWEHVRVVFFRFTKTPWVSLFFDYDLTEWQASGRTTGTSIYGDRFQTIAQEPQRIEIYYVPVRNLLRLLRLSDDDFDAYRLNGMLVWSGLS